MNSPSRSYQHFCALALALDRVGERWALLAIRELLAGPRRFSDLMEGMPGVATNTLTTRLEQLERDGLVTRRRLPPPAASMVYELTERGRALEPVILAFARWGHDEIKALKDDPKRAKHLAPLRSSWLALALKAYFAPPSERTSGRLQLQMPTGDLGLIVADGTLEIVHGSISDPDAKLTADEGVVVALLAGEAKLDAAVKHGQAKTEGAARTVERVLACFDLA